MTKPRSSGKTVTPKDEWGGEACLQGALSNNPTVSVIICTYNRPQSLSTCLESLEKQTIIPYEVVIVVDGGINSEVQEIIDSFKANDRLPIVQVTNNERNGTAVSMKIGAETASGEIVAYIDDDVVMAVDSTLETADTTAAIPLADNPTTLRVGADSGGNYWNGHIAELRYYDVQKNDTFVVQLSNGEIEESPSGGVRLTKFTFRMGFRM